MKRIVQFTNHIVAPIVLGGLIYIFFRPSSTLLLKWSNIISWSLIGEIREYIKTEINAPDWIVFNLPDGLFIYSYVIAMMIIWRDLDRKLRNLIFYFAIIPVFLHEFLQLTEYIPGTFDQVDIAAYLISAFGAKLIFEKRIMGE